MWNEILEVSSWDKAPKTGKSWEDFHEKELKGFKSFQLVIARFAINREFEWLLGV